MQRFSIGHTWEKRHSVRPAIVSITEVSGEYPCCLARICQPDWIVDYEYNSFGRFRVQSQHMEWLIRNERTVHLYPPGITFWEDTRREHGLRHSAWIHFCGGNEVGLCRLVKRRYGYAQFSDPTGRIGELFSHAAKVADDFGEAAFWKAQSVLCEIIDALLHAAKRNDYTYDILGADVVPEASDFARRVRNFLKINLGQRLSLHDIARAVDVSVSSLAHRYRRETGETPMTTLAQLRIERAKLMLLKGNPLKAVADQLGFCDAFHLSRTFKRLKGVSPRAFIRAHQLRHSQ